MARTFNRVPQGVNTPSSSDIKEYFFNQSNWKGLVENKNFLTVDQETFEDCNNVYVDSDGLLKSRPCLKKEGLKINNLLKVWNFDTVVCYLYKSVSGNAFLMFVNDNYGLAHQIETREDVKLINTEGKIFIFEKSTLRYYDIKRHKVQSAIDYVYVPVTSTVFKGVTSALESENELTTSYITKYLFDNVEDVSFKKFVGKNVTLKIDEEEFEVHFEEYTQYTLFQKVRDVDVDISADEYRMPKVSVSELGNMILYNTSNDITSIYYSYDGISYELITLPEKIVSVPVISTDGYCIAYLTENDIKVCKVLDDKGSPSQERIWYSLLEKLNYSSTVTFLEESLLKLVTEDAFAVFCKIDNLYHCLTSHLGIVNKSIVSNPTLHSCNSGLDYRVTFEGDSFIADGSTVFLGDGSLEYRVEAGESYAYSVEIKDLKLTLVEEAFNRVKIQGDVWLRKTHTDVTICEEYYKLDETVTTTNIVVPDDNSVDIEILGIITITITGKNRIYIVDVDLSDAYYDGNYPLSKPYALCKSNVLSNELSYEVPIVNTEVYSDSETFNAILNVSDICTINSVTQSRVNYIAEVNYVGQNAGLNINKNSFMYLDVNEGNLIKKFANIDKYDSDKTLESENIQNVSNLDNYVTLITKEGTVLTEDNLYINKTVTPLLFNCKPVYIDNDIIYVYKDNALYSNNLTRLVSIDILTEGYFNSLFVPEHVVELDHFYVAQDNKVYISSYPTDGEFKWYFPKVNTEVMDYEITNLHPISHNEVAIFSTNGIFYIQNNYNEDKARYEYYYRKSKLTASCKQGSDVITTYDGSLVLFATERGLAALTYQDFVASTEQTITYLSDQIHNKFKLLNTNPIKLFKYEFWVICYTTNSNEVLVYDLRNGSWWPWTLNVKPVQLYNKNDVFLVSQVVYKFVNTTNEYYDYDDVNKLPINWSFMSQRLHLNSPNNRKNISSIILTSVSDNMEDMHMDITLRNYRKHMHISDVDSFKFDVDGIRTYVKRLNYSKVNEFQYLLTSESDDEVREDAIGDIKKLPLSLSNVTIKYKITGQVR